MAYCTASDVKIYLNDAVSVEGDNPTPDFLDPNPESITTIEVNSYISAADQYINGQISAIYMVPLKKYNMGGIVSYPPPIPSISARLAARYIWMERLTGADKASGDFVENHYQEALLELNEILNGQRRLQGQRNQLGERFTRSNWHGVPPKPSDEAPQGTK